MKPTAYQGKGKYIFVSYSHQDNSVVFPLISELQKKYNVWFDEGINVGTEWLKVVANRLANCEIFLYVVSKNSLNSQYCQDEVVRAKNKNKKLIFVSALDSKYSYPEWYSLISDRHQKVFLSECQNNMAVVVSRIEKGLFKALKQVRRNDQHFNKQNKETPQKADYKCPYCPKVCATEDGLKAHIDSKHMNNKKMPKVVPSDKYPDYVVTPKLLPADGIVKLLQKRYLTFYLLVDVKHPPTSNVKKLVVNIKSGNYNEMMVLTPGVRMYMKIPTDSSTVSVKAICTFNIKAKTLPYYVFGISPKITKESEEVFMNFRP